MLIIPTLYGKFVYLVDRIANHRRVLDILDGELLTMLRQRKIVFAGRYCFAFNSILPIEIALRRPHDAFVI
jgi:hypothetical protein